MSKTVPLSQGREGEGGGGYFRTMPIRVCAVQRGRDFGALHLERGIHRDVSWNKV